MSNSSVIIDPKELRQFTNQLKQFNIQLSGDTKRLQAQFRHLGETWRDPAYVKFAQEFEQTMRNLERFNQVCEEVVPRLVRTAERVESVHK
jgi:WXG100 family type VII secretion target